MKNKLAALIVAIGFVLVAAGTSHNEMTPVILQKGNDINTAVNKELGPELQSLQNQIAAVNTEKKNDIPTAPRPLTLLLFGTGLVGLTSLGRWKTR